MKTLKLVLLTALLTIGLASCSSGDDDNSCANKTDTTSTTQQTTTTPATTETECSLQSATPNPVVGVTVRDNHVVFGPATDTKDSIKTVRFEWDNGYSITSGQPWEGVNIATLDTLYTSQKYTDMNIRAGRQGSNPPLVWFNKRSGDVDVISNEKSWGEIDSLNFAISGYLIINDDRYLVTVGQEGFGGANGWWVGGQGPGWSRHVPLLGPNYLLTPDKKWRIHPGEDIFSIGFEIKPN